MEKDIVYIKATPQLREAFQAHKAEKEKSIEEMRILFAEKGIITPPPRKS